MKRPDVRELNERAKALGIPTSKFYLDACKKILSPYQKRCPVTWNAFMGKKWILPQYRQEFYYGQELINFLTLEFMIGWCLGRYGYDLRKDEILNTKYVAACKSLEYQRPTYWLESELGKPLLETTLPDDFMLEDIHWRFPAMRIYLPKGLLTIQRENVECSLMYMDITRAEQDERMTLPGEIAMELKSKLEDAWVPTLLAKDHVSMAVTGVIDLDCPESGVGYAATTPITATQIKKVYDPNVFTPIASETVSDSIDNAFTYRMLRLAINILLLMGSYPLEYDPQEVIRAAKQEGKRTIPALLRAKFVGQSLLRPHKKQVTTTGETREIEILPHWVKGHWRRVAYGPKQSFRRLQWIGMYSVGEVS